MFIGIDIGTSSAKATLLAPSGQTLATHQENYNISTPHPTWAEQNPEMWLDKTIRCLAHVAAGHAQEIKAVSFSGQMHGIALADAQGRPVRDAIIWADSRTAPELKEVSTRIGEDRFRQTTLNRLASGYGLASLLWLKKHEPSALAKAKYVVCPKDYVRSRLAGKFGQEASDASSTCCMDVRKIAWAYDILTDLGLPCEIFPTLSGSLDHAGDLTREWAARCGLPAGIPLFFGGADTCMAGIGSGMTDEGIVGVNIGTGGQVGAVAAAPRFDKAFRTSTFCHPIPGRWTIYGGILAAGLSLKWFRDMFYPGQDFSVLSDLASRAAPGCGGAFFLPYLAGERTPWLDSEAKGMFWGLSLKTGAPEMCRAVLEGVTLALDQCLHLLIEAGIPAKTLLSMGGGAKSPVWLQLQADVFGRPVRAAAGGDAAAGAAIVAGVGAGAYATVDEGVAQTVRNDGQVYQPVEANRKQYREMKEKFRRLYLDNCGLFHGA